MPRPCGRSAEVTHGAAEGDEEQRRAAEDGVGGSSILSTETDSAWCIDLRRMVWIYICFT